MMKSAHLRRSSILLGALAVALAALAVEASGQSRSTPGRQLSDAIAEVLSSPFYEDATPVGTRSRSLLPPVAGYPKTAHGRVDLATAWSAGLPNAGPPLAQVESSPARPVGPTTFGAIASHVATALFLRCQHSHHGDPGRYTGIGRPTVIGVPPGEGARLCRFFDAGSDFVELGFLVVVPTLTTAGAATLGGSGFVRAVGGSALGFLGSTLFYKGMAEVADKESIHDLMIPVWILGGLMHGVTTAYLSG